MKVPRTDCAWVKTLLALVFLLPTTRATRLYAADADAVTVKLRGIGDDHTVNVAAQYVFGGATLSFQMAVEAPLGARLSLHADLVQTASGGIGATLLKDVPVSPELVFDGRTFLTAACALPAVPMVERPTRMLLLLRPVGVDQPTPLLPTPMEIFVVPPEKPGEWKKIIAARLAGGGPARLEVFGKGKTLRQFLRDRHVDFEDGGTEWPAEWLARTFYVAESPLPMPARIASTAGVRLALILPLPSLLLPGIYQSVDPLGGSTVKVTLPDWLDHLPDDPRCQQTLAEIFRLALEPRAPAVMADPNSTTSP